MEELVTRGMVREVRRTALTGEVHPGEVEAHHSFRNHPHPQHLNPISSGWSSLQWMNPGCKSFSYLRSSSGYH
jgi:hypothetical protein